METTVLMGHGSGGQMTADLIAEYFAKPFSNPALDLLSDSALVRVGANLLAFTTDSYVVDPPFFPGGDIGKLAVCGTVNDLAVSGATPLFLSAGFILEEGFPLGQLRSIASSMAETARSAGVQIVTGDTKVVKKGQCDKIFINTSGIGEVAEKNRHLASGKWIEDGDCILVNGYLGDHEMAILAARENLSFEEPVLSDVAPLNRLTTALLQSGAEVKYMRDITRGGLATVLSEVAASANLGVYLEEKDLPVRETVKGICEVFGFNPLYLANEGKLMAVVSARTAQQALQVMRKFSEGLDSCLVGRITSDHCGKVIMQPVSGGLTFVRRLAGEQLPRIC